MALIAARGRVAQPMLSGCGDIFALAPPGYRKAADARRVTVSPLVADQPRADAAPR